MIETPHETELGAEVQRYVGGFRDSAPVVVVPVHNAYEDTLECVGSLLKNTAGVPILVIDDASTDDRLCRDVEPLLRARDGCYVRMQANRGFVGVSNFAFQFCAPRDVVLVNSDVVVPTGWLNRLQAAAYSASVIATASPLTNSGNILSVPYRNQPSGSLPGGMTVDEVDRRVEQAALRLRPELPTAIGYCVYIRRTALDTVGFFDPGLAPGYGEEVDFSQRALAAGFMHVAADDLFVFHKGSRSFGAKEGMQGRSELQERHEAVINSRYPYYVEWVDHTKRDEDSRLALALERARAALLGYRIAIDATKAVGPTTGTQVVAIELIRALAKSPLRRAHMALIVPDDSTEAHFSGLRELVDEVVPLSALAAMTSPQFDLVHCPYQIDSRRHFQLLQRAARRLVVSQLDCIFYANPSYSACFEDWQEYRDLTQSVYAQADGITYLSQSGLDEARQYGLEAPPERSCITYSGVDHGGKTAPTVPPNEFRELAGKPYILLLSTTFKHKNRLFALRVMELLVTRYSWEGLMVVAGPRVTCGGSEAEESRLLAAHPELAGRVRMVGSVVGEPKEWLIHNATLLLYPSIREGFGIVPFEAAALDVPAISSSLASLPEVLGQEAVYFDSLNAEAATELVHGFLTSEAARRKQVDAIKARGAEFTWSRSADLTWQFYERLLALPPRQTNRQPSSPIREAQLAAAAEPIARNWPERVARGYRIWRKYGRDAFVAQYKQYLQWRKLQR